MRSIVVTIRSLCRPVAGVVLSLAMVTGHAKQSSFTYTDPLDARQQSIVAIAAFTANGNLASLGNSIHQGLDAGLTVSEIKEVIVQLYAYAGFPRSLNALQTYMDVLRTRKINGITDAPGKTADPYPATKFRLELGTENQTRLVGAPVKGEVYEFAPVIDQFLKEHLFGDIFGRNVLDYQTREIATIAALASLGGADNQLRSHYRVGMYNGLTKDQLGNLVAIIRTKVGETEGNNADEILRGVLGVTHVPETKDDNHFVGSVSVKMMVTPDSIFSMQMGSVTFKAGARTNWHYHPSGQILIVTEGTAYYQEKGKPKQILSKGQVVKCPPNVHHWHGATRHGAMTHMALSPDVQRGSAVWLERVTDQEYENIK